MTILSEDGGIKFVGLGQSSEALGKVSHLSGIHDAKGDIGICQSNGEWNFISPGGFDDDLGRRLRFEEIDNFLKASR